MASCRMYEDARDVLEGFSKDSFAGLGGSFLNLLVFVLTSVALFVVPPVGLAVCAWGGGWGWFALETALALCARFAVAVAFRQPLTTVLLHPLSVVIAAAIAVYSWWLTRFAGRSEERRVGKEC